MKLLKRTLNNPRRTTTQPPEQFREFEASMLFCPKCKQAVPVRKKLLLVLPEGDKYDYLCTQCGNSIGSKITKEELPIQFITTR
jgi:hypothetical protein